MTLKILIQLLMVNVKEGAESTFDKLKAGAKAVGKKITDPDSSIEDEYNREKS